MSGHLGPLIGIIAEKYSKKLLELLGYVVLRESVIQPNIDKIINFIGEPMPRSNNPCNLVSPIFSPDGYIAVSIKKGDFSDSDITNLLEDIDAAQNHTSDIILQKVNGGLILSNALKIPSDINRYRDRGIFCWDISRMFFYSSKVRKSKEMSKIAPTRENLISLELKSTYLRQWTQNTITENTLNGKFIIFIDNHESDFVYSTDHNDVILEHIYNDEIKTLIENRDISVNSTFEIHVLGKANEDLVKTSYINFSRKYLKDNNEIGATFAADLPIISYSVAPWSCLLS